MPPHDVQPPIAARARLSLCLLSLLAACGGPIEMASRYVKSEEVAKGQAALIEVSAAESSALAGASLEIPAGALPDSARITLEPGLTALDSDGALGPTLVWGPSDMTFNAEVKVKLPLSATPAGGEELGVLVQEADGSLRQLEQAELSVSADGRFVTYQTLRLSAAQVVRPRRCRSNDDCPRGLKCDVNKKICRSTPPGCVCPNGSRCDAAGRCPGADAGWGCTTNADCPLDLMCDVPTATCVPGMVRDGGFDCSRCPADTMCDPATRRCINTFPQPYDGGLRCGSHSDCPLDYSCDLSRGICVPGYGRDAGFDCSRCPADTTCDPATRRCINTYPPPYDGGVRCRSHSECPLDYACDLNRGVCVPGYGRDAGFDCSRCAPGTICSPTQMQCLAGPDAGARCQSIKACPSSQQICDLKTLTCVARVDGGVYSECITSLDCNIDDYCDVMSGRGVCKSALARDGG